MMKKVILALVVALTPITTVQAQTQIAAPAFTSGARFSVSNCLLELSSNLKPPVNICVSIKGKDYFSSDPILY